MRVRSAILATTLAFVPFTASAQLVTGLCIDAGLGRNWVQDGVADIKSTSTGTLAAVNRRVEIVLR